MGEIISARTHLLDGKIKRQQVVVIKSNYFTQELGLTTCSGLKVTKGIDSNYSDVIRTSDFLQELIPLSYSGENNDLKPNVILRGTLN